MEMVAFFNETDRGAYMKHLILILCFFLFSTTGFSQAVMKVGYVNMNKAIHLSKEGKKMKKYLEAQAQQLQGALKLKEQEVIQKETGLKNNILLNQQARSQKQKEIGQMKQALQKELGKAQKACVRMKCGEQLKYFPL